MASGVDFGLRSGSSGSEARYGFAELRKQGVGADLAAQSSW